MEIDEMRLVLARVAAYRRICDAVRRSANHTLFNGLLFLGLAYFWYSQVGRLDTFLLAYAVIGAAEVLVGLWKKIRPSPEGILVDSLLQFAWVGSVAVRQFNIFQRGGRLDPFFIFIGIWVFIDAIRSFKAYLALNRAFAERPTREQLTQVRELAHDVIDADPATDVSSLDLPIRPPFKVRLLGDVAMFADVRSGNLFLVEKRDLRMIRTGNDRTPNAAVLVIDGEEWGEFEVDSATWANYVKWQPETAR
ncbi:MAG TPA: hypothetical protein VGJ05_10420 [Fimbriiglobus sp.]|jgi:hypothetical protein